MALISFKEYLEKDQNISEAAPLAAVAAAPAVASALARIGPVLAKIGPAISTMAKSPKVRNTAIKMAGSIIGNARNAEPQQGGTQVSPPVNEPLETLGAQSVEPPTARVFSAKGAMQQPQTQQSGGSVKSSAVGSFGAAQQSFMRNLYGTGLQGR